MSFDEKKNRKSYEQWCLQDMKKAINAYKARKYKLNETCRVFNIPKAIYKRHLESKNYFPIKMSKALDEISLFSKELEDALANHILYLEKVFFGVTIKDVRKAAFELTEKNQIKHNFNKKKMFSWKKMVLLIHAMTSYPRTPITGVHIHSTMQGI